MPTHFHVDCFSLLNPLSHDLRAFNLLTRCNSWIFLYYKLSVSCLKPVEPFFSRVRLIRRLLKNFTGFSSLFPCRYSNSINRIVFLHRDGAQSAHGRANAQRGEKSQIRYGRWLYRRLKKTAYKLNIFSRTSQPRSHYFPFVWRLVSINYDSKRAGWSRKQSYESISST